MIVFRKTVKCRIIYKSVIFIICRVISAVFVKIFCTELSRDKFSCCTFTGTWKSLYYNEIVQNDSPFFWFCICPNCGQLSRKNVCYLSNRRCNGVSRGIALQKVYPYSGQRGGLPAYRGGGDAGAGGADRQTQKNTVCYQSNIRRNGECRGRGGRN